MLTSTEENPKRILLLTTQCHLQEKVADGARYMTQKTGNIFECQSGGVREVTECRPEL
jgi:hypothetical protein